MAPKPILRANSPLRRTLGAGAVNFLEHAAGSIERILPHVKVVDWREAEWAKAASVWASASRTEIRVTFAIGRPGDKNSRSLSGIVRRRSLPLQGGAARSTLDDREFDICNQIVRRLSQVMESNPGAVGEATIKAIRAAFDEYVVAQHIEAHYELPPLTIDSIFDALHTLSEQSYENKALTFGCIVDSRRRSTRRFRTDFALPTSFQVTARFWISSTSIDLRKVILPRGIIIPIGRSPSLA